METAGVTVLRARPRLRWAIALVAGLVFADLLFWMVATRVLAARTESWIAQQQKAGWIIATGGRTRGGGPFEAYLLVDRASMAGGERIIPGGLTWSADRIVLQFSLFHPLTLSVSAEGQQFLRLSHAPDLDFTAAREELALPLLGWPDGSASMVAEQLSGGIEGSRHPQDVQLDRIAIRLTHQPASGKPPSAESWRLDVRAAGIGLPDIGYWPLGATVNAAGAALTLIVPHLPEVEDGGEGGRAAAQAAAWRDGGGSLAVRDANLVWGPLAMRGQADLKLDSDLQPAGNGLLDVAGTGRALEALAGAGLISPGLATTASAALTLMSHVTLKEPDRPDADAVRLPFQLHDRTLSVGEIPVARLRPIGWGRPKPA